MDHHLFSCLSQAIADGMCLHLAPSFIICLLSLSTSFTLCCEKFYCFTNFFFTKNTGVVQSDPHWQTFMEQAVRLIYFVAESPDQLCSRLLQRSARLLLEQVTDGGEPNQSQVQESESQSTEEQGRVGTVVLLMLHIYYLYVEAAVTKLILIISCSSELFESGPGVVSVWSCGLLANISP